MHNHDQPKILFIVSQLGQGGAEQQLYYLLKYLKPNATVLSLAPGGYWLQPFQDLGYKVIALERAGSFDLRRLWQVMRAIRTERPDIVHLWMDGVPGAYGRLATFLLRYRPTIVGLRSPPQRDPGWYARLTRWWLNRHITLFVSNAEAAQAYLVQHNRVPAHKSRFIPNGIELSRFAPAADTNTRAMLPAGWRDKTIVGAVGRLAQIKGPDVLVRVARAVIDRNPNVRFVHAGDGPMRDTVHQLCRDLGLADYMLFLGSRSDVPDVMRTFDIMLLTSNIEGTPNAVMEAMATALPCVVTDVGDCKTVVLHGQTGFVAPVGDVNCLAEYVLKLVDDPALRQQMGRAGYERIQASDVHEMAKQYQALYQDALTAR